MKFVFFDEFQMEKAEMKNQISSLSLERGRLYEELENERNSALRIKSDANSARAESVHAHEFVNFTNVLDEQLQW